ncbi:arylacetamide deacetylase-like 4 [Paramormyrops kingsleyae]|uniref:arylacetamide deacetylase-like 4 n=1 Tax=Paramormyrops kingsleyae TaxID=1676925 RepID=UPI003B96CFBA
MDIGVAILITGFAAVFAAFLLLLNGLIYSEFTNSKIPLGVVSRRKLHLVHMVQVGCAVLGRILERMGLCHQITFTRKVLSWLTVRKEPVPSGLRIKDLMFANVPVRAYEPTVPSGGRRRALVYFHGGGWVLGSIDTADAVCRYIAKESDTVVISVGYRLAPEHRYPAQLDDCEAATCHFLSVAEAEFGVDMRRIAVGGDSAGGNLAAALCQRLAQPQSGGLPPLRSQVLIYPALQMADFSLPSYVQNQAVPLLFRGRAAFYFLQYLNGEMSVCQDVLEGSHVPADLRLQYRRWLSPDNLPPDFLPRDYKEPEPGEFDGEVYHLVREGLEPGMSPLLAEDSVLRLTPPTFVLTCEYDVLRDDGLLYRKRLEDLGVAVSWRHIPDGFHGILNFCSSGWLTFPSSRAAMDCIVEYVKTI